MPFRWKLKSHWQIDFNYYRTDCWGPKGWCRLLGHPGKAKTPLEHQKKETIHEMKDKYWARISEWPPSLWWWTPNLTLKNIGVLSSFTQECVPFYNWPSLMTIEFFSNRHCFPLTKTELEILEACFVWTPEHLLLSKRTSDFGFHPNIVTIFWYHGALPIENWTWLWKYVQIGLKIARFKWETQLIGPIHKCKIMWSC